MAKKTVDLTIRLKDGVSSVLRTIGGGLKKITVGFRNFALAGVAATVAVIGGLTALAKAYAEQESVNKKLKDTFDAAGESGAKAVVQWAAWATQIQRVTTMGDEEIMTLITLAKTMGVSNDKIKEATKGAIGLSKAFGIDMTSSMKMVALALQGEYTMLQRYIPALRAATTDTEKMAIVQTAMANGFKVATGELDTISGAWLALKGVVGDAMQEIGRVLFGDGGLVNGLKMVKDKIIELTEGGAITNWAKQAKEGLDAVIQTIKIITKGGEGRGKVLSALGSVIKEAFKSAAISAVEILAKYAPRIGMAIGKGVVDLIPGIDAKTPEIRAQEDKVASTLSATEVAERLAKKSGDTTTFDVMKKQLQNQTDKLEQMRADFASGKISFESDGLKDSLDNLEKVFNEFRKDGSGPNRKKLMKEMAEAVKAGTTDANKSNPPPKPTPAPSLGDSLSKGIDGRTPEGSADFVKTLMRGQDGLSKRGSIKAMRELLNNGGSGQLDRAGEIFKELTKGQDALGPVEALNIVRDILRGGGLGEEGDIKELIRTITSGQDALSRGAAGSVLKHLFGTAGNTDALGGARVGAPGADLATMTTNDYLKQIAENTAGGLF